MLGQITRREEERENTLAVCPVMAKMADGSKHARKRLALTDSTDSSHSQETQQGLTPSWYLHDDTLTARRDFAIAEDEGKNTTCS